MRLTSPLRYPGGKASLTTFLARTLVLNDLVGCAYFEPFAGGAGAALRLLGDGIVSEISLNDVDPCITAFWRAVLHEPERFAKKIMSVPVNMEEWRRQESVCRGADTTVLQDSRVRGNDGLRGNDGRRHRAQARPPTTESFELGFAAFYLNRCNRSGILSGSAPIGGYAQTGKWKMDVRFYRETLAERVHAIARHSERIRITNLDAQEFLATQLPHRRDRVFVYLDPPYYAHGNRLYLNFYDDQDHCMLSRFLQQQGTVPWVLSYDDAPFIRELYAACTISDLSFQHSLQHKKRAQELLISPSHVRIPDPVASTERREEVPTPAQGGGFDE